MCRIERRHIMSTATIQVPSMTEPGRTYTVGVSSNGKPYCNCPSWFYHVEPDPKGRKICKHVKAVWPQLRKLIRQLRRVVLPPVDPVAWEERHCPKCGQRRFTAPIFGFRCLRCGTQL